MKKIIKNTTISDKLSEFVRVIQSRRINEEICNESQTKTEIIEPILRILGWDITATSKNITRNLKTGIGQIDYGLYVNSSSCILLKFSSVSE